MVFCKNNLQYNELRLIKTDHHNYSCSEPSLESILRNKSLISTNTSSEPRFELLAIGLETKESLCSNTKSRNCSEFFTDHHGIFGKLFYFSKKF